MEQEVRDLDALFRKFNGQLERLEQHAKHSLNNAKNNDLEAFLSRLKDLETKMN
jgi:hypothetical protein